MMIDEERMNPGHWFVLVLKLSSF